MTIPRVPSGEHRHTVTLQQPGTMTPDGDGGYTEGWTNLTPAQMMAAIEPATVRALERLAAGTTTTTASHLVRIPFHPQVTSQTRVLFTDFHGQAHTLNVVAAVNVDQRDRELALVCTELVA
jgi:head-tail adaptor